MEGVEVDLGITRRYYDRISRIYDVLTDASEHAIRDCGIEAPALSAGERVLEVGFGTGHGLVAMTRATGPAGLVCGVDVSAGMAAISSERLVRETLSTAGRFTYSPSLDLAPRAQDLMSAHNEQPVTLIRAIYRNDDRGMQSFAEAFELRMD